VKTKPVKVGIVDLGRWAKVLARAAANSQEIEIVAGYSRPEEKRHVFEQELGVSMNYAYDAASQLTGITYTLGSNTLGNLTYAYDLAGRRTGVGGSYARTNAPLAASSATYNVNNQLTQWKGASLTYDANGNLTSDGTNTYTWNARNQLVAVSGGASASFQYDPFGRRVSKTIVGMTQYLYDGVNPVQEISGTTASANLLTGGLDEYFQRTDSAGARSFLTDALGSTLALADSSGALQTQYTFEPFGNTSVTGAATTNSLAYTGRELDATGLYFYRARYYHPTLQRFISEDPIGLSGGTNLYGYVGNSPASAGDPLGLWSPGGHDELIRHALAPCGVSPEQIHQIQNGSRAIDAATGTSPEGANIHSMRRPIPNTNPLQLQSVADAVTARNAFVANGLMLAQSAWPNSPDVAMEELGVAMHPMMDFTSPAHTLPNGDPIGWCGLGGCPGNKGNVLLHSPNDTLGIERVQDITPEISNLEDQAIRDAYTHVTGRKLACKKQ